MSFFNKLFGGGEQKKPQPKVAQAPKNKTQEIEEKKIKIEAAVNQLDQKISEFEDKQKKFEAKVDVLKQRAKQYLGNDKKKQAKKLLEEATRVNKQMESYTLRKKALVIKKGQLQQAIIDMDTIDAIEGAHEHIKDGEKYTEKLQDMIIDGKQFKMNQEQMNDKLKDLVGDQQDQDVDEMLNDLMKEVNQEKKKKIQQNKTVQIDVTVPQKQKNKGDTEKEQIARLLAGLE